MSALYSIRKKIGANPIVNATIKKVYMAVKEQKLRKYSIETVKVAKETAEGKKVLLYIDVPTHPNMGDLAQYCCIRNWLEENYHEYERIEISAEVIVHAENEFLSFIHSVDSEENLIFFQSGYCTQDLGGTHDQVHKLVVGFVRRSPVIMFPQTILYKNPERAKQTADVYAENEKLLLLCRDSVSYQMAQGLFPNNRLEQFPDIVTSLIGKRTAPSAEKRKGILICCRNDVERFYSDEKIAKLKKRLENIDVVTISDTTVQSDFSTLKKNLDGYVNDMIDDFSRYRAVITDRYHGTIFSLIAGTPVIVIKSNDHKVVTGVDWFKGIYDGNVWHIEDIEAVPERVREIYNGFEYKQPQPYFDEHYYKKLKGLIEDWRWGE